MDIDAYDTYATSKADQKLHYILPMEGCPNPYQ